MHLYDDRQIITSMYKSCHLVSTYHVKDLNFISIGTFRYRRKVSTTGEKCSDSVRPVLKLHETKVGSTVQTEKS